MFSPIRFKIFINDLSEILDVTGLALFADDASISCPGTNPNKIPLSLLRSAEQLSNNWKIKLNVAITQAIFYTKRKSKEKLPEDRTGLKRN